MNKKIVSMIFVTFSMTSDYTAHAMGSRFSGIIRSTKRTISTVLIAAYTHQVIIGSSQDLTKLPELSTQDLENYGKKIITTFNNSAASMHELFQPYKNHFEKLQKNEHQANLSTNINNQQPIDDVEKNTKTDDYNNSPVFVIESFDSQITQSKHQSDNYKYKQNPLAQTLPPV